MRQAANFQRLGPFLGFILALVPPLGVAGCESNSPPETTQPVATNSGLTTAAPSLTEPEAPASASASALPSASATEEVQRPPWDGPFFYVTKSSVGIYTEPVQSRRKKIAYAGEGARIPVKEDKIEKSNCARGWFELVDGGYVCGNDGTINAKDPRVVHLPKQPDLEAILPYRYARNTKNGTPLYKTVPNRDQQRKYEPYLFADKPASAPPPKPAPKPTVDPAVQKAKEDQQRRMAALRAARAAMLGEAPPAAAPEAAKVSGSESADAVKPEAADAGAEKTWWQEEDPDLRNVSINDLAKDSDDILATRLVKGFYIAVDKTFDWERRRWYRSTKGYVSPAERFYVTQGSDFKGVELDETWKLPVGWVYGWHKSRPKYTLDPESKKLKPAGNVKRFSAVNLTGREEKIGGKLFVESADGFWMRRKHLRVTKPGPPPEELEPGERWIDVNLTTQTLVLFEGTQPIYATLVSSGKKNNNPEKDHSTPLGQWRIREKHIASTMDGDGTASDLPYSIEGVPYVMYFHKAFALHGAFWHRNYGVRMSHGCVNLAPLDAKFLFFNTNPPVREGWHGAWAYKAKPGTLVVVHE